MKDITDFSKLRLATCVTATKFFTNCCKKYPEAEWVGLAVCPDNDVQSVFLMADHQMGLQKRIDQFKKLLTDSEESYSPQEIVEMDLEFMIRNEVPEWSCNDDSAPNDIDIVLDSIWSQSEEVTKAVRSKCLKAIVNGLQDFEQSVGLNNLIKRDNFLLLVIFPDPDSPKEVRKMAKELNPKEIYDRFAKSYRLSCE